MNSLTIINEQEVLGKHFAAYGDFENPLFLAKDVAEWIEYDTDKVGQMLKNIDEDEYITSPIFYSGQVRTMYFLTENGLYEVLMQSRKPIAKQFKREVKKILKSIRKHGAYLTPERIDEILADPDVIIKIATDLKAEKERRKVLERKINEDKPKIIFADAVAASKSSILIGELAKIMRQNGVEIGEKRLFDWLRTNNYLIRRKGTDYNTPTQKSMDLGLFEVKETAVTHSHGNTTVSKTTKVTGKG